LQYMSLPHCFFILSSFRDVQLPHGGHVVQEADLVLHHHHLHPDADDCHGLVDVLLARPQVGEYASLISARVP
jgi:hypothetical protein